MISTQRIFRDYFFAALFLIINFSLFSQERIVFKIVNQEGIPWSNATVKLYNNNDVIISYKVTDNNGKSEFDFNSVLFDRYKNQKIKVNILLSNGYISEKEYRLIDLLKYPNKTFEYVIPSGVNKIKELENQILELKLELKKRNIIISDLKRKLEKSKQKQNNKEAISLIEKIVEIHNYNQKLQNKINLKNKKITELINDNSKLKYKNEFIQKEFFESNFKIESFELLELTKNKVKFKFRLDIQKNIDLTFDEEIDVPLQIFINKIENTREKGDIHLKYYNQENGKEYDYLEGNFKIREYYTLEYFIKNKSKNHKFEYTGALFDISFKHRDDVKLDRYRFQNFKKRKKLKNEQSRDLNLKNKNESISIKIQEINKGGDFGKFDSVEVYLNGVFYEENNLNNRDVKVFHIPLSKLKKNIKNRLTLKGVSSRRDINNVKILLEIDNLVDNTGVKYREEIEFTEKNPHLILFF